MFHILEDCRYHITSVARLITITSGNTQDGNPTTVQKNPNGCALKIATFGEK